MVVGYYNTYKLAKDNGDSQLASLLEDRIEGGLIDLVCCFETQQMYDWEFHLKHFGIHKGAEDGDYVSEILGDVAKLMDGE